MANYSIHPTAVVGRDVEIAARVSIGPYCVIDGRVSIGAGTEIDAHSIVRGRTTIGENCRIGPASYVGLDPQHLKFDRSIETCLVIGDGCIIREGASLHRATRPGVDFATRLGERCFVMGQAHVGHDAQVGDDVILAHGVALGGHVIVGASAFLGGGTMVHQHCQIGRLIISKGNESITKDVPPFAAVVNGMLKGYNAIGVRRAGIAAEGVRGIRSAYFQLQHHRTTSAAVEAIRALSPLTAEAQEILSFIAGARRGLMSSSRNRLAVQADAGD